MVKRTYHLAHNYGEQMPLTDPHIPVERRLTGAIPAPRHKLLAAPAFRPVTAPPPQVAYVPAQLDMWGNDQFGDCVSAEEAFAKACHNAEIFIPASDVIAWARRGGFLNGAMLTDVMDAMQRNGFQQGSQLYNDGPYSGVDYSNESVLQAAIALGPVKIAIDHNALPGGAGNNQGWYATGIHGGRNSDHCVSLCGYGPAGWLFQQLGVTLPSALQAGQPGYLLYTWHTIGFVDHQWIMGTCTEAWVRNPTTVGVPPLPDPTPNPPTPPTPGPTPQPPIPTPPTPPPHILPLITALLQVLCGLNLKLPPPWGQVMRFLCAQLQCPCNCQESDS
jgi:hypothetical protein